MSNRFYINNVQLFGNNEMPENTRNELDKQGAKWIEYGWVLRTFKITDPQGLMDAVTKDSLGYLKEKMTEHYDPIKEKDVEKKFEELTDIDALGSTFFGPRHFLNQLYTHKGEINLLAYRDIENWIEEKRAMTPYVLWKCIEDCVEYKDGKLVLKENKTIIAEMY